MAGRVEEIEGIGSLKHLLTVFTSLLLVLIPALPVRAQSDASAAPLSKAPYRIGERLTYNVAFANFYTAAHVELWVAGHGTYFGRDGIQLRAHVETTGVVNAALYSLNNDYISYVAPESGQPYRTQQFRREAGSNQEVLSEYTPIVQSSANTSKSKSDQFVGTFDFLSALYRMRALPLAEDARYSFAVRDADTIYEAELKVTGRELIKTNVGSFNTIVTQLRFPRNSSLNDYKIQIFFSDDDRHVPVLFTAHHPAGDIRAELAGSELPGATPTVPDPSAPAVAASESLVQPAPNPDAENSRVNSGIPGIPVAPDSGTPPAMNPDGATSPGNSGIPGIPVTPNPGTPPAPRSAPPMNPVSPVSPNVVSPEKPTANPGTAPALPPTPPLTTALPAGLPFAAGEQLNFNVYVENAAQPVGLASLQVRARSQYFGRDGLMLTGKTQTVGTTQTFLSAIEQITTYVDPNTLLPFRYEMSLQDSPRRSNQTVLIDQDRGSATIDAGTRVEVPVGTYDLLSVFYALRSFNLKSPRPNAVSLFVNDKARTLFITFLKRETIELSGQQVPALQLSLTTDDPLPDKNGLRLWVSDDQRRLPLRLTVVTTSGKVRADLAILPIVRQ